MESRGIQLHPYIDAEVSVVLDGTLWLCCSAT
jgi:hypothetical protein